MHPINCILVLLAACGSSILGANKHAGGTDSGNEADADVDADADADADADVGEEPEITWAQAVCERSGTDQWFFNAAADDPQGIDTIASGGLVAVFDGEDHIKELGIACSNVSGLCSGEYSAGQVEASCLEATMREFRFVIFDEDGNRSGDHSVHGSTD
jgi:hypothetical protein